MKCQDVAVRTHLDITQRFFEEKPQTHRRGVPVQRFYVAEITRDSFIRGAALDRLEPHELKSIFL